MKETKKITLSAMMAALAVALMVLGAVIETLDMSIVAVASFTVVFVQIEIGKPYNFCTWLAASLLSFIFFPHSFVWAEFLLLFGVYPILKGYIERLPRPLWLPIKLLLFNVQFGALYAVVRFVIGMEQIGYDSFYLNLLLYLLANVTLFAYDWLITVVVRLYFFKYREKFKKFLK